MSPLSLTPAQLARARKEPLGAATVHGLRVEVLCDGRYGERFVFAAMRPDTDALVWQAVIDLGYMCARSASVAARGDDIVVDVDGENSRGAEPMSATVVLSTTGELLSPKRAAWT